MGVLLFAQASSNVDFPGPEGFLGTRASLMLDVVFLAMFLVIVVLAWSVWQVRRGRFLLHKQLQVGLGLVLLVAVAAFEVEIRLFGWESRAAGVIGGHASTEVWRMLYVHLVFAVSTTLLWPVVIVRALRQFPKPPEPAEHSASHRFWARLAAADMTMTAITGWVFYWLAFVR